MSKEGGGSKEGRIAAYIPSAIMMYAMQPKINNNEYSGVASNQSIP